MKTARRWTSNPRGLTRPLPSSRIMRLYKVNQYSPQLALAWHLRHYPRSKCLSKHHRTIVPNRITSHSRERLVMTCSGHPSPLTSSTSLARTSTAWVWALATISSNASNSSSTSPLPRTWSMPSKSSSNRHSSSLRLLLPKTRRHPPSRTKENRLKRTSKSLNSKTSSSPRLIGTWLTSLHARYACTRGFRTILIRRVSSTCWTRYSTMMLELTMPHRLLIKPLKVKR